jgi:hypothetical protein
MIISLTKNSRKVSNTSWLSRPVNASGAGLSNYMDRQDAIAFWLAYSFAFDDTEPLPSMFRRRTAAVDAEPQPRTADHSDYTTAPAAGLSIFRVSNMTPSYILACVLFVFAALDGALLTMARFTPDKAAATWSAPERDAVRAVALSPSIAVSEESQASAIAQAESDQLSKQLEAGENGNTAKSAEAAGVCAVPSLKCWKSATYIR